jgi:hypothetical protein
MLNYVIIVCGVLLYATAFILGFIVGRFRSINSVNTFDEFEELKKANLKPDVKKRKVVNIDEKKFVTSVSTESLQKKGKDLGTQVVVEDDVETAVLKLTLLKKK